MRKLILAALVLFAACAPTQQSYGPPSGPAPPLPMTGPILYTCENGTQLTVEYRDGQALVAIVGGVSMALPLQGNAYYSNGRYGLRGSGATTQWEVGRSAPTNCRGS